MFANRVQQRWVAQAHAGVRLTDTAERRSGEWKRIGERVLHLNAFTLLGGHISRYWIENGSKIYYLHYAYLQAYTPRK